MRPEEAWAAWSEAALANTAHLYPHFTAHITGGPDDRALPLELHPVFHASYDWHSDVHMYWLLAALLRRHPEAVDAGPVVRRLEDLAPAGLRAEADYLRAFPQFERPYGWGWLLVLAGEIAELAEAASPEIRGRAASWHQALAPLVSVVRENVIGWIQHAYAPMRGGMHDNSALGLLLVSCGAAHLPDPELETLAAQAALSWFGADRSAPVAYEPGGLDFLSPTLAEAHLMRRVLPDSEFAEWIRGFLPDTLDLESSWLRPPRILDLSDARQGHLIGLGLDRAWHCRALAGSTALHPQVADALREAARRNAEWANAVIAAGVGFQHAHWLSTFAFLAAECGPDPVAPAD